MYDDKQNIAQIGGAPSMITNSFNCFNYWINILRSLICVILRRNYDVMFAENSIKTIAIYFDQKY